MLSNTKCDEECMGAEPAVPAAWAQEVSAAAGGSWWVTQCKPDEPPLALACPSSLKAGASTTLAWEGGPAGGKGYA
ncbi:hypothetical protein HaLaN_25456 [Haematococcus lacustris]|uniref:Uncharacterized protein n=1 Tax=Haematococcus lacustris TaxID=44745 RepID=A0A6A0A2L8_HAELA|nr:hypothetical protein HaLaN_25456 [Haematococcus lacustris]